MVPIRHLISFLSSLMLYSTLLSDLTPEQLSFKTLDYEADGPIIMQPDTCNLIFASFAGLLQQWPNSFYPNGHSIVPGIIPRATLLYHGVNKRKLPPNGTEWLAFAPEMSYSIHAVQEGETALYTYASQRPLRIIYLDGQSASVGTAGYMDSQSLLVNGTVTQDVEEFGPVEILKGEYRRGRGLCELGKELGFEGVVRMNTGFELLWCNFRTGLDLVRVTNTTDPFADLSGNQKQHNPSFQIKRSPFYSEGPWESTRAATWQYHDPGETRVKLDPSGFISFYDRLDSLAEERTDAGLQHQRPKHRLYGISPEDAAKVKDRLKAVLAKKNAEGWHTNSNEPDWQGIARNIIQHYSGRLVDLASTLGDDAHNATKRAMDVRRLTYAMLFPYINFSNFSISEFGWLDSTEEECKTSFTSAERRNANLTESTRVLIGAIEGTLEKVCAVAKGIFVQSITLGLPYSYSALGDDGSLELNAGYQVKVWQQKVAELMVWLGWSSWARCEPQCSPNQVCMIPMWPATTVVWNRAFKHPPSRDGKLIALPTPECLDWVDSKPLANLPSEKMRLVSQPNAT